MKGYLLDTHVLLWYVTNDDRLKPAQISIIESDSALFLSHVSLWELVIKAGLGRISIPNSVEELVEEFVDRAGVLLLPISKAEIYKVGQLPMHHRDPFDRMLVAQCINHDIAILSSDRYISKYDISVI